MQNLAVMFLFATFILLTFSVDSVLAQMDKGVAEETMKTTGSLTTPLKQLAMGVDPHDIECREGQQLVFKASNWQPACVNESSYSVLYVRGWIAPHDPIHEDLNKMVKDYMEKHQLKQEIDENQVEIEEEISVDGQTGVNGTAVEEPKNHVIKLREDMEMGAN